MHYELFHVLQRPDPVERSLLYADMLNSREVCTDASQHGQLHLDRLIKKTIAAKTLFTRLLAKLRIPCRSDGFAHLRASGYEVVFRQTVLRHELSQHRPVPFLDKSSHLPHRRNEKMSNVTSRRVCPHVARTRGSKLHRQGQAPSVQTLQIVCSDDSVESTRPQR